MITFISVYSVSNLNLGLSVEDNLSAYIFSSLILFILLILKPVVDTFLFPIHLITLNMTKWFTFAFIIYFWSALAPEVKIVSFKIPKISLGVLTVGQSIIPFWLSVLVMSLILIFTSQFLFWVFK